jgi:hypothetical protein
MATKSFNQVEWIVDSGASRNMTGDRSILTNVKSLKYFDTITIADGKFLQITAVGDYKMNGYILTVYVVEGLDANLLSVSDFVNNNGKVKFEKGRSLLTNMDNVLIGIARESGGIYMLKHQEKACMARNDVSIDINDLHEVYGHINCKSLRKTVKEKLITGLTKVTGEEK